MEKEYIGLVHSLTITLVVVGILWVTLYVLPALGVWFVFQKKGMVKALGWFIPPICIGFMNFIGHDFLIHEPRPSKGHSAWREPLELQEILTNYFVFYFLAIIPLAIFVYTQRLPKSPARTALITGTVFLTCAGTYCVYVGFEVWWWIPYVIYGSLI